MHCSGCSLWDGTMIIESINGITDILHKDIAVTIEGHVKLVYEEKGLTVVVNSIPELFFNNVSIADIMSDITIELS